MGEIHKVILSGSKSTSYLDKVIHRDIIHTNSVAYPENLMDYINISDPLFNKLKSCVKAGKLGLGEFLYPKEKRSVTIL